MSAPLALGVRRRCLSCGSAFYDLKRSPIVCPKCGVEFTVVEYARRPEPARKYGTPYVAKKPVEEANVLEADADEAPTLDSEEDEDGAPVRDDEADADELLAPEDEAESDRP